LSSVLIRMVEDIQGPCDVEDTLAIRRKDAGNNTRTIPPYLRSHCRQQKISKSILVMLITWYEKNKKKTFQILKY